MLLHDEYILTICFWMISTYLPYNMYPVTTVTNHNPRTQLHYYQSQSTYPVTLSSVTTHVSSYIIFSQPKYSFTPLSLTTHVCSYIIISHNPRIQFRHYHSQPTYPVPSLSVTTHVSSKPTYPVTLLSLTTHACCYIIISHNPLSNYIIINQPTYPVISDNPRM
jgi:hypothetical protein